jgi:hypothetical protein
MKGYLILVHPSPEMRRGKNIKVFPEGSAPPLDAPAFYKSRHDIHNSQTYIKVAPPASGGAPAGLRHENTYRILL